VFGLRSLGNDIHKASKSLWRSGFWQDAPAADSTIGLARARCSSSDGGRTHWYASVLVETFELRLMARHRLVT
jgi:hypothetical protein